MEGSHESLVHVMFDCSWKCTGEQHDLAGSRQIAQFLGHQLDLAGSDARSVFIDLGVRATDRIDDGSRSARRLGDTDKVIENTFEREAFDDIGAGQAAHESGGNDWRPQPLERACSIDALATGKRHAATGAVSSSEQEVGYDQRAVHGCVERDGSDHPNPQYRAKRLAASRVVRMPSRTASSHELA